MRDDQTRPTQKTIATMTGLAITTVSRALKDDPKIARATREQVAHVAHEIGYVPDRAAQRLRTGKTRTLSLLLNPHDEMLGFGNAMISGISRALQGSGYHLIITPCFPGGDELQALRHLVRNRQADGIFLSNTRNFDERVKYLLELDFPFVSHGRTDFTQGHSYVDFDNMDFAYQAVKRLAGKGCRKPAILLPEADLTFHQHIRYGFMKAVSELGLDFAIPETASLGSSSLEIKAWATEASKAGVDGYVCPGEASFFAISSQLRQLGQVLGQDYSAVVKTSSPLLGDVEPKVDCISEDIGDAGYKMGQALLTLLSSDQQEPEPVQYLQRL